MKETAYGAVLGSKIKREIGGQVFKISDNATLGLPDNMHIRRGLITYIETKIGNMHEDLTYKFCYPWDSVNDLRQYEVCKKIRNDALLLWIIYYPSFKYTAVLDIDELDIMRSDKGGPKFVLTEGLNLVKGHGLGAINRYMEMEKKLVYARLKCLPNYQL
jgi:hypothetical protein